MRIDKRQISLRIYSIHLVQNKSLLKNNSIVVNHLVLSYSILLWVLYSWKVECTSFENIIRSYIKLSDIKGQKY